MEQLEEMRRRTEPREPRDPWKHRNESMRCQTCMWYAPKSPQIGRCRRHAPRLEGYPAVFPVDWCGDHKLSEGALE